MDKPIIISKFEQENGHLPKHAEGIWRCIEVKGDTYRLQRLKHDGTLGSTRKNNFLKVSKEIYEALLPQAQESKVSPKEESAKSTPRETAPTPKCAIGTRKSRWIAGLVEQLNANPLTQGLVEKMGEGRFTDIVLQDTDAKRAKGKAYSSINSALKVWKLRILKGYNYGE